MIKVVCQRRNIYADWKALKAPAHKNPLNWWFMGLCWRAGFVGILQTPWGMKILSRGCWQSVQKPFGVSYLLYPQLFCFWKCSTLAGGSWVCRYCVQRGCECVSTGWLWHSKLQALTGNFWLFKHCLPSCWWKEEVNGWRQQPSVTEGFSRRPQAASKYLV